MSDRAEGKISKEPGLTAGDRYDGAGDIKTETTSTYQTLPFWTRMGCTPDSFRRRTVDDEHNRLNQTLRSRHMHMIAIGE